MSAIGRRIRARRDALGMTQAILAEKAGLGRSSIAQYERGRTRPRARELEALAGAMNMSVDELLTGRQVGPGGVAMYDAGGNLEPEQAALGEIVRHPLFDAKVRKTFHEFLMALQKALYMEPDTGKAVSNMLLREGGAAFNADQAALVRYDAPLREVGKVVFSQPGHGVGSTALLTLKIAPKGVPFKSGQTLLLEPYFSSQVQEEADWFIVGLRGKVHFARPNPRQEGQGFLNSEGLVFSTKAETLFKVLGVYSTK